MGLCSVKSSETCFSSPSQLWYGQFPPGCMEQKQSHSQGVWISSFTSCPMQIKPPGSSLPLSRACREAVLYALGMKWCIPLSSLLQLFCMCPGSAAAFQKISPRIRSHIYHEGLCYKEMPWTHEGSERTKIFVPLQHVHSQPSKLRVVPTSSLDVHLMSQPLPEKWGEKKVFLFEKWVFTFFHSLSSWVGHHNTFFTSPLVKRAALT